MKIKELLPYTLAPILLSIFPVLALYKMNVSEVLLGEILLVLIPVATLSFLLVCICSAIYKNIQKGTLCATLLLLFFYYFHYLLEYFNDFTKEAYGTVFFKLRHIVVLCALIFAYLFYKILKAKKISPLFFNIPIIVFGTLSLFATAEIIQKEYNLNNTLPIFNQKKDRLYDKLLASQQNITTQEKPDIYFIILDRYASNKTLLSQLHFDNANFTNKLEGLGFYVAKDSNSNYQNTLLALSSTLNMMHLPTPSTNPTFLDNPNVINFLLTKGYTFVDIQSAYSQENSFKVDKVKKLTSYWQRCVNKLTSSLDFLFYFLYLKTFVIYCGIIDFELKRHAAILLNQFKQLKQAASMPSPKFVFCHIECPHNPNVFDAQGNIITNGCFTHDDKDYIEQIKFINTITYNTVAHILQTSKTKPIILLQGDHGIPLHAEEQENPSDYALNRLFGILNTWYIPPRFAALRKQLYPSISPINNFALICNHFFNTNLAHMKDESFLHTDKMVLKNVSQKL